MSAKTSPLLLLSLLALLLLSPHAAAQHGLSGLFQDPSRYAPDSWSSSSSGGSNNQRWRMGSADPLGLLQTMQALLTGRASDSAGGHSLLHPEVSVRETASERVYFIEVPGIARNEVTLAVEGGRIVRVVGAHECGDSTADEYCVERTVEHAILIEHDIEPSKITANYDLSVLRVHMPKKTALRRTIPLVDRLFGLNQPSHDAASRLRVEDYPGTREMPQGAAWVAEPVRDWARDPSRRQEHRASTTTVEKSKKSDTPPVLQRAAALVRDAATGVWQRAENLAHRVEDDAGWLAETAIPDMESEVQATQRAWADRAKEYKDKASASASSAAVRATNSAASVADSVTQAMHRAKDAVQDTAATAAGRAERAAADAKATAGAVADDALKGAANVAHKAREAAGDAVDDAKDAGWSIWNWADEQAAAVKGGAEGAVEGAREGFHQAKTAERAKHEAGL